MDVSSASFIPRRAADAAEAREVLAAEGAVIVTGLPDERSAIAYGREVMGDKAVRIGTQFEATKAHGEQEAAKVAEQPADSRGRKRSFAPTEERMVAHNDGFAFGDYAPDHLFLWCERPAARGGDSFLVDTSRLLDLLAADPEWAAVAEFCRTTDIDHSEPNYPQDTYAPIARTVPSGRFQGRYHPYLASVEGPLEDQHMDFVRRWEEAVVAARDTGPMFRVDAGEMICLDNYRVLHGRDGHSDPARRVCSIWGWSTDAVAIPDGPLDIVVPKMPKTPKMRLSA
ncbi:TauD/TfdA family dioxygenase [Streptomyces sp. NPDC050704]|uniref:TauD/TfdA family dioxygenase n=1 Tax=Streptomyces sp. NPDC050704 TaxID=3157219 RepID=UPI0034125D60